MSMNSATVSWCWWTQKIEVPIGTLDIEEVEECDVKTMTEQKARKLVFAGRQAVGTGIRGPAAFSRASCGRVTGNVGCKLGRRCLRSTGLFPQTIVGTSKGVVRTRTVRRKPAEEIWSAENMKMVSGVPWGAPWIPSLLVADPEVEIRRPEVRE